MTNKNQRVLIEEWFPFEEVSIECQRERGMNSALPPIYYLHTYWARRPLSLCKATILGALLPANFDREYFLRTLLKIDPSLQSKYNLIQTAKAVKSKEKIGYNSDRMFKLNLSPTEQTKLNSDIKKFWQKEIHLLDPMAGGGSIPFEWSRMGINGYATDINPLASIIQLATCKFPQIYGPELIPEIHSYADQIYKNLKRKVEPFFPREPQGCNDGYIWIRTIKCIRPDCELIIPLSPHFTLAKNKVMVKLSAPSNWADKCCSFSILENPTKAQWEENIGTVNNGTITCPRCKGSFRLDEINAKLLANNENHQLLAIIYLEKVGKKELRKYRVPNKEDLQALEQLNRVFPQLWEKWQQMNLIPDDEIASGLATDVLLKKGIDRWFKCFNQRQIVVNMTILEELNRLKQAFFADPTQTMREKNLAILVYLQFALDKILNYNSSLTVWMPLREVVVNTFNMHDFSVSWSYAEMNILEKGFNWAVENILKAYKELTELSNSQVYPIIKRENAQALSLGAESIDAIIVDPPYYNNVIYSELADYFFVWMKKILKDILPDLFDLEITDKDNEAVANSSRFIGMGAKNELAQIDYQNKMKNAFKEMNRVLTPTGILVVMFTHKATEAWDSLTKALLDAGFEITASWPVVTESEISLHIAKKNAVSSSILLICRKRIRKVENSWWEEDILPKIHQIIKEKATYFQHIGIEGVNLFISTFGPVLGEFSKYYPVKNIEGNEISPETALNVTRKIITDMIFKKTISDLTLNIDLYSKFYLLAWKIYQAREFPFDEARNLAIALGLDIDDIKNRKIVEKKASSTDVILLAPTSRESKGIINIEYPDDKNILVNAIHIGILAFHMGGITLYQSVVKKMDRIQDKTFRNYMESLYRTLPDIKDLEEKSLLSQILISIQEK